MNQIIAGIRLISLFIVTLICFFIVIIFYYITPQRYWAYVVRGWAKATLYCVGVKIEIIGNFPKGYLQKNCMIVANHISWLDIPVLYAVYFVSFVGRIELKKWPLLSLLVKSGGTIFIDRSKKRELININQIVTDKLLEGATIGFFPEGKAGDGKIVLPFKSPLLESAIAAKTTLIPLVIKFHDSQGNNAHQVNYANEVNLWQTVTNSLLLNGIKVKIICLDPILAENYDTRTQLADLLHSQISTTYIKGG